MKLNLGQPFIRNFAKYVPPTTINMSLNVKYCVVLQTLMVRCEASVSKYKIYLDEVRSSSSYLLTYLHISVQ